MVQAAVHYLAWTKTDPPSSSVTPSDLKNKRIAHKFSDGWAYRFFKHKCTGRFDGLFAFYYDVDRTVWRHELGLDGYGVDKDWVFVTKDTNLKS